MAEHTKIKEKRKEIKSAYVKTIEPISQCLIIYYVYISMAVSQNGEKEDEYSKLLADHVAYKDKHSHTNNDVSLL